MLVLTRKSGEGIMIGDQIQVTILEIRGHQVRLGIQAPSQVAVYREEIHRRIQEENREAAHVPVERLNTLIEVWERGRAAADKAETNESEHDPIRGNRGSGK